MFCSNCGKEINEKAEVCLSCGKIFVEVKKEENIAEKSMATIALIAGSLSFFPFIIFGSIAGLVLGIISSNMNGNNKTKAKVAIWLSSASLAIYTVILIIGFLVAISY